VDRLRDGPRRPRGGALEQEVLEEVGGTGELCRLVTPTDPDPDADGHGPGLGHPLGHEPDAVAQPGVSDVLVDRRHVPRSVGGVVTAAGPPTGPAAHGDRSATAPATTTVAPPALTAARRRGHRAEIAELVAQLGIEGVLERHRLAHGGPGRAG